MSDITKYLSKTVKADNVRIGDRAVIESVEEGVGMNNNPKLLLHLLLNNMKKVFYSNPETNNNLAVRLGEEYKTGWNGKEIYVKAIVPTEVGRMVVWDAV